MFRERTRGSEFLDRILREARPDPGSKGLLLSFGAGFTAFAALLEFC